MRAIRRWMGAACAIALLGFGSQSCAQLDPLDPGCGNKVVEEGEDCDGTFDGQAGICRAAGQSNACRYDCTEQACPPGYGCGMDRICRRPTGQFELASTVPSEDTVSLTKARVDGNDQHDLVELSADGVRIRFIDEAGRVERTATVPAGYNRPVLGDVTGSGRDDLLLFAPGALDGGGLAVLRARENRELAATVYASVPFNTEGVWRFFTSDVIAPPGQHQVLAFTSGGILATGADTGEESPLLKDGDFTPSEVAGFAAGHLINKKSPCPEIVVAMKNAGSVQVLSPCVVPTPDGAEPGPPVYNDVFNPFHFELPSLRLPTGQRVRPGLEASSSAPVIGTGVFLADQNGDAKVDIVVETLDTDGNPARVIGFGVGDGSFHSDSGSIPTPDPDAAPGVTAGDNEAFALLDAGVEPCEDVAPLSLDVDPGVLAIADFNEDGIGDGVGTYGISVSLALPGGLQFLGGACAEEAWTRAVVDDFNGDGHLDVVAVPESGQRLTYLAGDGKGTFSRYEVRVDGTIVRISSGDYDGDFRADVLVSVRLFDDEQAERLEVMYGKSTGNLEPPVELGVVAPVDYLMSAPMFGGDATTDLGVFDKSGNAAILFGSTDRLLIAPFVFFSPDAPAEDPEEESLIDFATGRFSDPDSVDIFALTQSLEDDGALRYWFVDSDSLARLTTFPGPPGAEVPTSPEGANYDGFLGSGLRVEAADFDADALDEVLLIGRTGVATLNLKGEQFVGYEVSEFAEELEVNPWAPVLIADFDGDGTPEAPDVDVAFVSDTALVVLWNDGGIFDARAATMIAGQALVEAYAQDAGSSSAHPGLEEAGSIVSATALHLDKKRGADLVVTTEWGVYRLAYSDGEFARAEELEGVVGGGGAIVGGDFTGDGVDDLVLAGAGELQILKGIPVNR